MASNKFSIQLATLLCSLAFSTVVLAEETNVNENKIDSTDNAISDVNTTSDTTGDDKQVLETQTETAPGAQNLLSQETIINDMKKFQQMEKQWYQQRREARKKQLENRNQQLQMDVESDRNEYIKHREQRREFFNKLNEQRRKDFEQRRQEMRLKTYQTCTDTTAVKDS